MYQNDHGHTFRFNPGKISVGHPPSFGLPQQPSIGDEEGYGRYGDGLVDMVDMDAPHYTLDQDKTNRKGKVRKKCFLNFLC